jgi:hypothetical protein
MSFPTIGASSNRDLRTGESYDVEFRDNLIEISQMDK